MVDFYQVQARPSTYRMMCRTGQLALRKLCKTATLPTKACECTGALMFLFSWKVSLESQFEHWTALMLAFESSSTRLWPVHRASEVTNCLSKISILGTQNSSWSRYWQSRYILLCFLPAYLSKTACIRSKTYHSCFCGWKRLQHPVKHYASPLLTYSFPHCKDLFQRVLLKWRQARPILENFV